MALWKWPRRDEPTASAERRAAPRHIGSRVTSCQVIALPAKVPIQVKLRDISSGGIGLLSRQELAKGNFLVVELQGANKLTLRLRACVVHATAQPDGSWILGCVLERRLQPEELEAMF